MKVIHKLTLMAGTIAWETEYEVGVDADGFTWTGTREQFEKEWGAAQ